MTIHDLRARSARAQAGSLELERLERGELTLDEYIEARLEVALEKWKHHLDEERLAALRETLREQMATDPVVRRYAVLAAGRAPGIEP